jgi:hypothetical protein
VTALDPARILVISSHVWLDSALVHAALDTAAARLHAAKWLPTSGINRPRRDLSLIVAPAVDQTADLAAHRWAAKRDVPTVDPPDGWEENDDPTADEAAELITQADPDIALVFNRLGSPYIAAYAAAAAITCHIPTWTYEDHRGTKPRREPTR